jgi:hypothetical protein
LLKIRRKQVIFFMIYSLYGEPNPLHNEEDELNDNQIH